MALWRRHEKARERVRYNISKDIFLAKRTRYLALQLTHSLCCVFYSTMPQPFQVYSRRGRDNLQWSKALDTERISESGVQW